MLEKRWYIFLWGKENFMNKHERSLYFLVFSLFVLMIGFQNCESSSKILNSESTENLVTLQNPSSAIDDAGHTPIRPIQATLVSDDTQTSRDYFSIYSNIKFTLTQLGLLPESVQKFTWDIERIFPKGVIFQHTITNEQSEYIHTFPQRGVYNISVDVEDTSIRGHKTLVVGLCNENQNILEITLGEGTLQPNTKSVFNLSYFDEDETATSSVLWRVMHQNLDITSSNNQDKTKLVTQWDHISGEYLVEIFVQFEGDDCIFHRKKWVNIDPIIQPHFNYVRPVDDRPANVALLNNNIYAYVRNSESKFVWLDIQNADKCLFNGKIIPDCHGSALNLNEVSLGTNCQENEFLITAYRDDGQAIEVSDTFYNYCPANDDFCAFGPQRYRPDEHRCHLVVSESSEEEVAESI